MTNELIYKSAKELLGLFKHKDVSPVEVTRAVLGKLVVDVPNQFRALADFLAEPEATVGITVETDFDGLLCAFLAQLL